MASCNESSQSDAPGGVSHPLTPAGLRRPPRGDQPTGVFVVIEMAVLSCVSAMAMVSIIVSIDDGVVGQHGPQAARVEERAQPSAASRGVLLPAAREAMAGPAAAQVAR